MPEAQTKCNCEIIQERLISLVQIPGVLYRYLKMNIIYLASTIVQNHDAASFNKWKQYSLSSICLVAKSCLTLCNPVDSSPSDSSVLFSQIPIFQARILSGLPFLSPQVLPNPGTEPVFHALAGRFFTTELPEKLKDVVANCYNLKHYFLMLHTHTHPHTHTHT